MAIEAPLMVKRGGVWGVRCLALGLSYLLSLPRRLCFGVGRRVFAPAACRRRVSRRTYLVYVYVNGHKHTSGVHVASREIRKQRCSDVLDLLTSSGDCVFFTLTTPDRVDYATIRARWRSLRHVLLQSLRRVHGKNRSILYVMNYEAHKGYFQKLVKHPKCGEVLIRSDGTPHGWHIHGVINCFIPLDRFLPLVHSCGFGRTDVRKVTSVGVADYLTKHALKAYAGLSRKEREKYRGLRVRLVNTSRGLPSLDEYAYTSSLLRNVRELAEQYRTTDDFGLQDVRQDWRRIYLRAQVCHLLGLARLEDFKKFFEKLCHSVSIGAYSQV